MFAKLYDTELGQILVKQDDGDNGAEVRLYFTPKGLGVCSISFDWQDDDSETQWKKADSVFEKATKEFAIKAVKGVIDQFLN